MQRHRNWSPRASLSWVGVAAATAVGMVLLGTVGPLGPSTASAGDGESTDVPVGTVAFFGRADGTCPAGWRAADQAQGRLLVGTTTAADVGKVVGTPLSDQEDRTHTHAFSATVDVPYKSISAADGPNRQGAASKKYMASGPSKPAPSGLPFVQLTVCEKQ